MTGKDVSPVTLTLYKQVLLAHLNQGIAYRGITMRMELHSVTHYVGHLVETPVIQTFHGVQDTSLHRLQAIHKMRHGTFQDNV